MLSNTFQDVLTVFLLKNSLVLSQIQEDDARQGNNCRRMLRFTVFVVFPIMIGMVVLVHQLVIALVTEEWEQCVPYLQVICFASMWYPVHDINHNLLQFKGRRDLFLRLEIINQESTHHCDHLCKCALDNNWVKLTNGIPLGAVAALYIALAKVFRMPELQEAPNIIHRN